MVIKKSMIAMTIAIAFPYCVAMEPEQTDRMSSLPNEIIIAIITKSASIQDAIAAFISLIETNKTLQKSLSKIELIKNFSLSLQQAFPESSIKLIEFSLVAILNNLDIKNEIATLSTFTPKELDNFIQIMAKVKKIDPFFVALKLYSLQKIILPTKYKIKSAFDRYDRFQYLKKMIRQKKIDVSSKSSSLQKNISVWAKSYITTIQKNLITADQYQQMKLGKKKKKLISEKFNQDMIMHDTYLDQYKKLLMLFDTFLMQGLRSVDLDNGILLFLKSGITLDYFKKALLENTILDKRQVIKNLLELGYPLNALHFGYQLSEGGYSLALSVVAQICHDYDSMRLYKYYNKQDYDQEHEKLIKWVDLALALLEAGAKPTSDTLRKLNDLFNITKNPIVGITQLKEHPLLQEKKKK